MRAFTSRSKIFRPLALPGILSDIDGVVYRGGEAIAGSDKVIRSIYKPFAHLERPSKRFTLPFTLLTNGGGEPEQKRADYINHKLFKDDGANFITKDDIILCHTPFSQESMV